MAIRQIRDGRGFTLLEVAIAVCIVGMLAGGVVALLQERAERRLRSETLEYMEEVRRALLVFARVNSRLPYEDTSGDGRENVGAASYGYLPYLDLGVKPADSWGRPLKYDTQSYIAALNNHTNMCNWLPAVIRLQTFSAGTGARPGLKDGEASSQINVGAVIVSGGPGNADGLGFVGGSTWTGVFDVEDKSRLWLGGNDDGWPYYIRMAPNKDFDDLVVYLPYTELYDSLNCDDLGPSSP